MAQIRGELWLNTGSPQLHCQTSIREVPESGSLLRSFKNEAVRRGGVWCALGPRERAFCVFPSDGSTVEHIVGNR